MKLMFAFLMGMFCLIVGFSFLNYQAATKTNTTQWVGVVFTLLGGVLFMGALYFQMKKNQQE